MMLYMLDTASVFKMKKLFKMFPLDGVTTNPTIIAQQEKPLSEIIPEIQEIIGKKMMHMQAISRSAEDMVKETLKYKVHFGFGENFYIKIPVTPEGIKAISMIKEKGIKVTATAVFTQQQAVVAAKAGADFVAPYVNRLDNISSHGINVVTDIKVLFDKYKYNTKVLAASFKNVDQIYRVSMSGTDAITITPDLFETMVNHPMTDSSVAKFEVDGKHLYDIEF